MNEVNVKLLTSSLKFKSSIITLIKQRANNASHDVQCHDEALRIYRAVLNTQVSKVSSFGDPIWDFCAENPRALFKACEYRIDFSNYVNIPETILFELKCVTLYWLEVGIIGTSSKKKHKTITIVSTLKLALAFFEKVFDYLRCEYGSEFIASKKVLLSDLHKSDIQQALINRPVTKFSCLSDFLANKLHDPMLVENVLGKPFLLFCDVEYHWTEPSAKVEPLDMLPNDVFEECVTSASLLVVDFLSKIGGHINDRVTVRRKGMLHVKHDPSVYSRIHLDHINAYRLFRLTKSGYKESFMRQYGIPEALTQDNGKLFTSRMQERRFWYRAPNSIPSRSEIKQYLHVIQGACLFLFLAFTGMRTSELKFIRLNNWEMTTGVENGRIVSDIPQIATRVSKGRDETHGLFQDKWVLIPIVVDALSALELLATISQNKYLYGAQHKTLRPSEVGSEQPTNYCLHAICKEFFKGITDLKPTVQTMRDTLAYQMFRIDLGLPFISYQLKHLVDLVEKETSVGTVSNVTLGYGEIGQTLTKSGRIRQRVEREKVESNYDPDGAYYGGRGEEHRSRMQKLFQGYIEAGYTKQEVFQALAEQGVGLVDVGGALCYGDRSEEFDLSLPCVGSLRCNPIRCKNAVITQAHLPRWKEIYLTNQSILKSGRAGDNRDALMEAMQEARDVIALIKRQSEATNESGI